MSEELIINNSAPKKDKYETLIPQLSALIQHETDLIANLANTCAALKQTFNWFWVGFYIVKNNELVLGPFQGSLACTRIKFGKGVCGSAWANNKSLLVPDVETFPGHIACSSLSVSEIVVPVFNQNNQVLAVIDIDHDHYNILDETDVIYLEKIAKIVASVWPV
jgi:GAF domain-containing protein